MIYSIDNTNFKGLSDIKYLLPRMKYSKQTPKRIGYTEGFFMESKKQNPAKQMLTRICTKIKNILGAIKKEDLKQIAANAWKRTITFN